MAGGRSMIKHGYRASAGSTLRLTQKSESLLKGFRGTLRPLSLVIWRPP